MNSPIVLTTLATRYGLELRGDGDVVIEGVSTLEDAGQGQLSFFANSKYRRALTQTRASAVIAAAGTEDVMRTPARVRARA